MGWQVAVNVMNFLDVGAIEDLGFDASWWYTSVHPLLTIRALEEENLILWQISFETTLRIERTSISVVQSTPTARTDPSLDWSLPWSP